MSKQPTCLSLGLFHILDEIGASEKIRKLHKHISCTRDILCTLENDLKSTGCISYSFGSYCEGTTILGLVSDRDVLEAKYTLPVVEKVKDVPSHGLALLIVTEEWTYPGYVKLQVFEHGVPCVLHGSAYNSKHTGYVYAEQRPDAINGYSERNGPADTYRYEIGTSLDRVKALESAFIPQVASSFWTRRRCYDWPTKCDMDAMGRLGCFYVSVGHPNSLDYKMEWRMSFSRQERMLMFSLNETQHKCYILLKTINKELIEKELRNIINSYHCKTCLFFLMENRPATLWRPENLCQCVLLCLSILHQWVYRTYCPNFFIREENMFDRKTFRTNKVRLLQQLRSLIKDRYIICYMLETFCRHHYWSLRGFNTAQHIGLLFEDMLEHVICTDPRNYKVNALGVLSGEHHPALIDIKVLDWVAKISLLRGHTKNDTRTSLSYLQPVLHLNQAQSLISLWFYDNSRHQSVHLTKAFDFHFGKAQEGYCIITTNLVLVTVLYRVGKFADCKRLLETIETNFKSTIPPMCVCQEKIFRSRCSYWKNLNPETITFNSFLRNSIAVCVKFFKSDMEIIPTALRYELFRSSDVSDALRFPDQDYWYDFAVVDAQAYLYFLQYLVYTKLGVPAQKYLAVNKLRETALSPEHLEHGDLLGHRETACNLLGWIYIQEGHFNEAIECFLTSWKIRPVHNAAKWHVRQLMARLVRGRFATAKK